MAKEYQPILNQQGFSPNTGAMVDRLKGSASMVSAVADIGKIAIGLGEQYTKVKQAEQIADVRSQVGQALDPLIQEGLMGSSTYRKEVADEAAIYQESLNRLPLADGGTADDVNTSVSRLESEVQKRMEFLTNAKDQNRMSSFAFEQNVKAITRKFISDNPALRDEILNVAKNTLEDQGIVERLKYDEQASKDQAKVEEDELKDIRQNFEKFNIAEGQFRLSDGSLNFKAARQAIDRMRDAKLAKDAFLSDMDVNKAVTESEKLAMESSGVVPLIVEGQYMTDTAAISNIFTENATDFPKAKLQATAYLTQQLAQFKANPRIARFAGSQVVKDGFADYEKSIQALNNAMQSFNSLEDLQKFTQNQKSIMSDTQSMNLIKDVDVPRLELMIKLGSTGNLINTPEGREFTKKMLIQTRDIFTNGKVTNANMFAPMPGSKQTAMSALTQEALKAVNPNNPESVKAASQVVGANIDAINDPNISPSPMDQMKRADTFIMDVGKPEFMEKFIDVDPNTSNKYLDLLDKYNGQIDQDLEKYFVNNPNKSVKLEINPGTGTLSAQGGDQQFNAMFTSRINNSLKAYANLRVQTPKEVWKDFYEEYFPGLSQGKSYAQESVNRNNPLNLKDATTGKFREFNSLEDAVVAYETQFRRYAEGKTDGIKRTTIKSIIDLWRPSSDRRGDSDISQQNYYNAVSEFMQLTPNTPLDLNDKETMANLISAMAQIETGKPLNPLRVSSFLKNTGKKGAKLSDIFEGLGGQATGNPFEKIPKDTKKSTSGTTGNF
jgi:hypothetical protein